VETDQSKRRDMYWECQKLIHDDGGTIIPVFPQFVDAANSKLRHGEIAGDRELDGAKIGERWWFA
jgi:peptide/nickel transport system substrate-binding protein